MMQRTSRLKKEMQLLASQPPPGVSCWQNNDQMDDLRAQILGSVDSPYEGGIFNLEIIVPERYPFEPPKIRFLTPIYHPNIDTAGRICLDILKLPPKGAWKPSLNLATVLTSIHLLMSEPNPDDPLMADISSEFKYNRQSFLENAKQWTLKYATPAKKDEISSCLKENQSHVEDQNHSQLVNKNTPVSRKRSACDSENAKKFCL
ncbi:ubiquitin-conjugating enzyme E2 T isoform X2 [Rhincodon typus]|nr:ubiquitin-conjugating enzyme E2 T isoform X2 [Rhincodon typus]XP_020370415.1 ubiquitin-conjugating enzyme E2 T isoform X2 [Rhincodon typus]XP_048467940.1 ubiquitin-conjugating enzyme E2 T isoform X2 [Rhincodon typus]XP_048467941.1 ubiquitin-conjugating enzyme E2 T isoform X2 [Rhincodon typus]XP_048467942.1 ubiquitin-conjugating enzyme E2 T isoform X2 [Rhincodon typus]XP_048467943.1 ubiquitin-conjugating enzyme E2 T isoform X2 [Rhincodon typus]